MINRIKLREDYHNRLADLQYKRRKKKRDFILLALLMVYFMEYFTNSDWRRLQFTAPFLLVIKNIENVGAVVRAIDEGLSNRGKLAEHIKDFENRNKKTIESLTSIIPQKPTIIEQKGDKNSIKVMKEQTEVVALNNDISLTVNQMVLGKGMKQWNTQRDSKVRKTAFHQTIDRQVVEINDTFKAGDFQARFPADTMLPDFDRYNCRCYLTYFN